MLKYLSDSVTPRSAWQVFRLFLPQITFFSLVAFVICCCEGKEASLDVDVVNSEEMRRREPRSERSAAPPRFLSTDLLLPFGPNSSCQTQ